MFIADHFGIYQQSNANRKQFIIIINNKLFDAHAKSQKSWFTLESGINVALRLLIF